MKRWYNMGWIQIADFNADGVVNQTDADKADAAVLNNLGNTNVWPMDFGNGDINDDGVIDLNDYFTFHAYYDNVANRSVKSNFGAPRASDL